MIIVFRADASLSIGTGHVVRCLALADGLSKKGGKVRFVCRGDEGSLQDIIRRHGHAVSALPSGIDMKADSYLTFDILEKENIRPDWLIVDHYGIDISWEFLFRETAKKIMVIDDLADKKHDCDILLDQNCIAHNNRYDRLVPESCIRLLGPGYALLRSQFREVREHVKVRNGAMRKILVCMGGVDHANVTCKILRALAALNCPDITIDVVIGASNPHREDIQAIVSHMPNTVSHLGVDNMAALFAEADLAIGASGTTTWERCCLGVPSIVIILADNQKNVAEDLAREGILINLGWHEHITEECIKNEIEKLIGNHDERKRMGQRAKEIVDGKGVEKVVGTMISESARI